MKYMYSNLKSDVDLYNVWLIDSGSSFFFVPGRRNGYTAIDLYSIDENGKHVCLRNLVCGSPRECFADMAHEYNALHGKKCRMYKTTRKQAKSLLSLVIDFDSDFFTQSLAHVDCLVVWAKITKYRKPKNANGSTGRYFFEHLKNRVKI